MKVKLFFASLAVVASTAFAQEWPQKQVKVVVPLGPGSSLDIVTRIVFEQVARNTGKTFVIENRPGASGTIAASSVVKSVPDGHTLFVNTWTQTILPSAYKNLSYSVESDFTNISPLITQPFVFTSKVRWKNFDDMVKYGQQNPGKLAYATAGKGSGAHLCMEKFAQQANLKMLDVPYKSTTEPLMNIMSGDIDTFCNTMTQAIPLEKDSRIVLSAVLDSKRSPFLPDVPTLKELGYDVNLHYWVGVFGPAKMNEALVNKINKEIELAMQNTTVKARLWVTGSTILQMTPKQFDSFIHKQIKQNAEVVARSKIVME